LYIIVRQNNGYFRFPEVGQNYSGNGYSLYFSFYLATACFERVTVTAATFLTPSYARSFE